MIWPSRPTEIARDYMSKKVVFIDAFSAIHVGNGALLDNSYKIALEKFKANDVVIITSDPETNRGRYKNIVEDVFSDYPNNYCMKLIWAFLFFVNCTFFYMYKKLGVPKWAWLLGARFRKIALAIEKSDIVVSISGESINDHFAPQMYMRCYLFYLCIRLGKDFYVFPQSIGPIFRNTSKKALRLFLSGSKVIFSRDIESFKLSQEIWEGKPVNVVYCPDVAVTQESIKDESLAIFNRGKKVVGITLSDVPDELAGGAGYSEKVVSTICNVLDPDKYCILIMPSNYKRDGISCDYKICEQAYQEFLLQGFEVDILQNMVIHPDKYQGIQRSLYLFISSRMHVGILATSAAIPTIMLNTQHKIRGYMKNIGMEDFVIEYGDIESQLPVLIRRCIEQEQHAIICSQLFLKNQQMRYMVTERFGLA